MRNKVCEPSSDLEFSIQGQKEIGHTSWHATENAAFDRVFIKKLRDTTQRCLSVFQSQTQFYVVYT